VAKSFLISVSCPSAKACIAVGRSLDGSGNQIPFAEHWTGVDAPLGELFS
jgi:hypothetical protein